MKRKAWLFLLLGLLALPALAANPYSEARAVTRKLTSATAPTTCSAVVIAPGAALTAKHCADMPTMLVEGKPAVLVRAHPIQDVALLAVPGLACPCATPGSVRPAVDEGIVLTGYLYGTLLMTQRGEYLGRTGPGNGELYGIVAAPSGPGMSGGGAFRVFVTGEIQLVGIIAGTTPLGGASFYVEVSKDALRW